MLERVCVRVRVCVVDTVLMVGAEAVHESNGEGYKEIDGKQASLGIM